MSGTAKGGQKAAATMRRKFGDDFYRRLGAIGGKISGSGGFARDHELAVRAGRKGGSISKRKKVIKVLETV